MAAIRRRESPLVADLGAERAERVVDDLGAVGGEENQVAGLRAGPSDDLSQDVVGEELDDRRLQSLLVGIRRIVDLDVGETLRTVDRHEGGVFVDFLASQRSAARNLERRDAAVGEVGGGAEHLEIGGAHQVGELGQLERHAQVRLVGAVVAHRVGVGHDRKRLLEVDAERLLEHGSHQAFHQVADLELVEE